MLVGSNLNVRVYSEFDGYDSSVLAEQINHLLLADGCGNIFDEKVGVEVLSKRLSNRGSFSLLRNFVFSL